MKPSPKARRPRVVRRMEAVFMLLRLRSHGARLALRDWRAELGRSEPSHGESASFPGTPYLIRYGSSFKRRVGPEEAASCGSPLLNLQSAVYALVCRPVRPIAGGRADRRAVRI